MPLIARTRPPLGECGVIVPLEIGAATGIDSHKVQDNCVIVERALTRKLSSQPDMFDMVAKDTERPETFEVLYMCCVVVAPDLVAVQLAPRITDTAVMARRGVYLATQRIPGQARQHVAQIAVPARLWHQLDSQAQRLFMICHLVALPSVLVTLYASNMFKLFQ